VLPKNPWLADLLLALALERAVGSPVTLDPLDDAIEEQESFRRAAEGTCAIGANGLPLSRRGSAESGS
jgi:CobQ-like glutamine amidotransferase family enzyme